MKTREKNHILNPVHIGINKVRIDEVDPDTYESRYSKDAEVLKHYVVAIGWQGTYIGDYGHRPFRLCWSPKFAARDGDPSGKNGAGWWKDQNKSHNTGIRKQKAYLRSRAYRNSDEILYFVDVYTENRRNVEKLYS